MKSIVILSKERVWLDVKCPVYIEYNMLVGSSLLPETEQGDP